MRMRFTSRRFFVGCTILVMGFFIFYNKLFLLDTSEKSCDACFQRFGVCKCLQRGEVAAGEAASDKKLGRKGWIMDCITWNRKWETPVLADDQLKPFSTKSKNGEDSTHRKNLFKQIFTKRDWPAHDASYSGLQASGPGAMLRNAQGAIAILHSLVTRIKVHLGKNKLKLLDAPCGDMQWMAKYLQTRDDIVYTGVDIVPELIAHNRKTYKRLPRTTFIEWDIAEMPLSNHSFDVVLIRDMLQHLWMPDALRVLKNVSQMRIKFLLVTTFPGTTENEDVDRRALGGRKSAYNLEYPPFNLEPPVCSSYDWNVEHLALWRLPLLQKVT